MALPPMPDRIYRTRWWSLCRWGWWRWELRIPRLLKGPTDG